MPVDKRGYTWPQWYIDDLKRTDYAQYAELMGKDNKPIQLELLSSPPLEVPSGAE